jgi:predicted nuclease of restriction endonuclease-like (RecB) superfamily
MGVSVLKYKKLIKDIGFAIHTAKSNTLKLINTELVKVNWQIGKYIVEFEQDGKERAEYGSEIIEQISKDLKHEFGAGFSRRNVLDMRRFYLCYQKWQTVSAKLSWSHFTLLLSLSSDEARRFYEKKCISENLSVRDLEKNIQSSLYERLLLSNTKTSKSQVVKATKVSLPLVKDPYILDFLDIKPSHKLTEKSFEQKIINNLQQFLLELGKGFTFVGRQYKISLRNKHFYVDLVFYHRILKCFVLIDLKIKEVQHNDIGQMNLYLNYFKKEENVKGDNEPIGIILSADKDDVLVEYATGGLSNKIFVSKYQLYLPDKKMLQKKVKNLLK